MLLAGGDQAHARFLLNDDEDVGDAALASASVGFLGLTIVPAQPPSASGSWGVIGMGGIGTAPLAATLRATCSQSSVSESSVRTDMPSISSPLLFAAGRVGRGGGGLGGFVGGGDGDGWCPLSDANSIGKSKRIQLVLVKSTKTQICFGCIGMDERHFCWSNQCSVRAHKKQRFDMGCNAGYFISTRHASRLLAAFRELFLDAAKFTNEVRGIMMAQGPDSEKTTRKWEDFMVKAQVAWCVLEEERNGRQNRIICEESNEDKESKEEAVDLPKTPLVYKWEDTHSIKEVSFKLAKTEVKDVPAITELHAMVRDLSHRMKLMAKSSRLDALSLMDHLWKSIAPLVKGIELSNKSVHGMREDLGDVTKLQGKHNIYDVIEGITLALTSKPWEEEFMVLSNRVTTMANMLSKVDKDHQAAGCLLLRKLNSVGSPSGGLTSSPGAMVLLSTSMAIVDVHGNHCGTLGDLLQEHRVVKNKHSNLKVDYESLSAVVTAQGGQVLDGLDFASEAMVCILVVQECPRGDAFDVFLDVTSLFCCDSTYSPVSGWEKLMRGMEDGFSPTARKVVTSYSQPHCS
jgi:hypothetical protein